MASIATIKGEAQAAEVRATGKSGLLYHASTAAADGVLDRFFAAYDRAFVLPNEKEGLAGFAECLALNAGPRYDALRARYGPFREFVVVVHEPGGAVAGGLNFIAFPLDDRGGRSLSLNLNYVFVASAQRRRGLFKAMVGDLPALALGFFARTNARDIPAAWTSPGASPPVYTFIEQNDPYRMSPKDYALDTRVTGLDQLARIALWGRRGARIVDFAYVQPALTAGQAPDPNLVYAVLGPASSSLDPTLLRDHLLRFFAISVLKGRDPYADPEARRQLTELAAMSAAGARVDLLAMADLPSLPRPGVADAAQGTSTLRGLLRARTLSGA